MTMNQKKYIAKNPSPAPQTITVPQGLLLNGNGLRSTEPVTLQLPPMSQREITFDETGKPIIDGCIQDLTVTAEHDEDTPLDQFSTRRERTRIRNDGSDRPTLFYAQAKRLYPTLAEDHGRFVGGHQLLAQFSHLRSSRDNTTAIYTPAALNMTYESRTDSLYHAATSGQVNIESVIGNGHDRANAITMRINNPGTQPVRMVVPQGTMFEQQSWNGMQNLVVKEDVWIDIQPGQTGTFPLPAFCANSSGSSPRNNRMNLTPFVFHDMGGTFKDQDTMWRTTDSRRPVSMR
jgi:hypothetical protein